MLCNNVHWNETEKGKWNYSLNCDAIHSYWEESVKNRASDEAVWTVGIRGIHDAGMETPPTALPDKIDLMAHVIADHRALLNQYVQPLSCGRVAMVISRRMAAMPSQFAFGTMKAIRPHISAISAFAHNWGKRDALNFGWCAVWSCARFGVCECSFFRSMTKGPWHAPYTLRLEIEFKVTIGTTDPKRFHGTVAHDVRSATTKRVVGESVEGTQTSILTFFDARHRVASAQQNTSKTLVKVRLSVLLAVGAGKQIPINLKYRFVRSPPVF